MIDGKDELHKHMEMLKGRGSSPFLLDYQTYLHSCVCGEKLGYFGINHYIPYQETLRKDLEATVASHRK